MIVDILIEYWNDNFHRHRVIVFIFVRPGNSPKFCCSTPEVAGSCWLDIRVQCRFCSPACHARSRYRTHGYNVYHLFDGLTWYSISKGREKHTEIYSINLSLNTFCGSTEHFTFHYGTKAIQHQKSLMTCSFFFLFVCLFFFVTFIFFSCVLTRHNNIAYKMSTWQFS